MRESRILVITFSLLAGCQSYLQYPTELRTWSPTYNEKLTITTEPAQCRIYVQDQLLGISPLEVSLDAGTILVMQSGKYPARQTWSGPEGFHGPFRREGPTTWDKAFVGSRLTAEWRITAVKEGYRTASRTHAVSETSPAFLDATRSLKIDSNGHVQNEFTGKSSTLLVLEPLMSDQSATSVVEKQHQERPDTHIPTECNLPEWPNHASEVSLVVFDFRVITSGGDAAAGEVLSDLCRQAVHDAGRFTMVTREDMSLVLKEEDFTRILKCDDATCLVDYGKKLRAQKIIYGRASELGQHWRLSIQMLDVARGVEEARKTSQPVSEIEGLADFVPSMTCELLKTTMDKMTNGKGP